MRIGGLTRHERESGTNSFPKDKGTQECYSDNQRCNHRGRAPWILSASPRKSKLFQISANVSSCHVRSTHDKTCRCSKSQQRASKVDGLELEQPRAFHLLQRHHPDHSDSRNGRQRKIEPEDPSPRQLVSKAPPSNAGIPSYQESFPISLSEAPTIGPIPFASATTAPSTETVNLTLAKTLSLDSPGFPDTSLDPAKKQHR